VQANILMEDEYIVLHFQGGAQDTPNGLINTYRNLAEYMKYVENDYELLFSKFNKHLYPNAKTPPAGAGTEPADLDSVYPKPYRHSRPLSKLAEPSYQSAHVGGKTL